MSESLSEEESVSSSKTEWTRRHAHLVEQTAHFLEHAHPCVHAREPFSASSLELLPRRDKICPHASNHLLGVCKGAESRVVSRDGRLVRSVCVTG